MQFIMSGSKLIKELLEDCGYNYPEVISYGVEDERLVALFTLPHASHRRGLTAFIAENPDGGIPRLEVRDGFVAVLTLD